MRPEPLPSRAYLILLILVAMAAACGSDRPAEPAAADESNPAVSETDQTLNSPSSVSAPQSTAASSTLSTSTDLTGTSGGDTELAASSPVPPVPSTVPTIPASSATTSVSPSLSSPSTEDRQPLADLTGGCGGSGRTGTFYQSIDSGGVARQFFVSVRSDYDSSAPNALYVGLHGRDYDGARMRDYLGLEANATSRANEIFVYPDALPRVFGGDASTGWQNGPIPSSYAGTEDLDFIDAMIAWLGQNYCIDSNRVFATGQSWGGDFTNVLLCFRGLTFRAGVSVAANEPYYLPSPGDGFSCQRQAPIWIMHGKADRWFSTDVGRLLRDFWVKHNACAPRTDRITFAAQASDDETFDYQSCEAPTRYSSYTATSGHQIPENWYAEATMAFLRDF